MNRALSSPSLCLVVAVAALLGSGANRAGAEVAVSYDLGVYSHYVWRGITVTDGAVLQPALTVGHDSGFSANVWGNFDLDDANDHSGEFIELDVTLSYGREYDGWNWTAGLINYNFPNDFGASTNEAFFGFGFDVLLSPTITVYYDFDQVEDLYATFGLGYGSDITDVWSWSIGATVGYAGEDWAAAYSGGSDGGFHDGNLTLSLDYGAEHFSAGVMAAYTDSLDDDVLTPQPTDLWGGGYVSFSF